MTATTTNYACYVNIAVSGKAQLAFSPNQVLRSFRLPDSLPHCPKVSAGLLVNPEAGLALMLCLGKDLCKIDETPSEAHEENMCAKP